MHLYYILLFRMSIIFMQILEKLIFFDHMDLQIIKFDLFNEIILIKPGFVVPLEFCNGGIQPDGFSEIELVTDFVQCPKDLVCTGVVTGITDDGVL